MKTGLSILVVACCLSVSVMGQMKIENGEGNILVGNYGENTIGNAAISLLLCVSMHNLTVTF